MPFNPPRLLSMDHKTKRNGILLAFSLLLIIAIHASVTQYRSMRSTVVDTEIDCVNSFDDDFDGSTDCADSDCASDFYCTSSDTGAPAAIFEDCDNEFDDDFDGDEDCADSDCASDFSCISSDTGEMNMAGDDVVEDCCNHFDDDFDGLVDCDDPECVSELCCNTSDST